MTIYGALAIPVVGVAAGGAGNPNVGRIVLLATPILAGTRYYFRTRAVKSRRMDSGGAELLRREYSRERSSGMPR
jgi:hypothetical protein